MRGQVCACVCVRLRVIACVCAFVYVCFFRIKKGKKKNKGNLLLDCPDKDEFAGVKAIR